MRVTACTEEERMAGHPGIIFADGPLGRRARVAGSGIDVFEVIKAYHDFGNDRQVLVAEYDWLKADQLDAALCYYAAYPEEIDAWLAVYAALTPEHAR